MALRERNDSDRFNGYTAYIILKVDGREFELLSRIEGSEIVLEDEPLPVETPIEGNVSRVDLFISKPIEKFDGGDR